MPKWSIVLRRIKSKIWLDHLSIHFNIPMKQIGVPYTWTTNVTVCVCNKKKSSVNLVLSCVVHSSYPIRHYWIIWNFKEHTHVSHVCTQNTHTANAATHSIYIQRHPLTVSTIFDVLSLWVNGFAFLWRRRDESAEHTCIAYVA